MAYLVGGAASTPAVVRAWIFCGMLLVSLYDFYFFSLGFPIVPMVGIALLLPALPFIPIAGSEYSICFRRSLLILAGGFLFVLLNSLVQIVIKNGLPLVKSPIGVIVGVGLFSAIIAGGRSYRELLTLACWLGRLHVLAWLVQFAVYRKTGEVIDYVGPFAEQETRWNHGGQMVRLSGLFVEPAIYSQFALTILSIRGIRSSMRMHLEDLLLLFTMFASFSVTGFATGCGYLLSSLFVRPGTLGRNVLLIALVALGVLALA